MPKSPNIWDLKVIQEEEIWTLQEGFSKRKKNQISEQEKEQEITQGDNRVQRGQLEVSYVDLNIENLIQEMRTKIKQEGGQIRYCIDQWENIKSDREILDTVKGTHIDFEEFAFSEFSLSQIKFTKVESVIIQKESK
jgi:hypothetical protein